MIFLFRGDAIILTSISIIKVGGWGLLRAHRLGSNFGSYNFRQDSMLGLIPCINRQNFVFLKIVRIRPEILTLSRRLIIITIGGTHMLIVRSRKTGSRYMEVYLTYIYLVIPLNHRLFIFYFYFYYGQWVIWAGGCTSILILRW